MVRLQKTVTRSILLLGVLISAAHSAEQPPQQVAAKKAPENLSTTEVRRLVGQLDSNRFAERTAATARLRQIGLVAVAPLAAAAPQGSLELQVRAMNLLGDFYRSKNEELRSAARDVLEQLQSSSQEAVAQRAGEILKFPFYELTPGNWLGKGLVHGLGGRRPIKLGGGGGIVIGGGEVRLGNGAQIVVSGVEKGYRFVDIIQGSGLGVLMIENEQNGAIEVYTCQQQASGDPEYQRYQADSAEELAKQHPKIHAFYDRFKGYRGGMVMNGAVAIQ